MDDIQRVKEKLDHDLRLWTTEKQRAIDLQKMKDDTYRKSGRKREKEAQAEIAKIEYRLNWLENIKGQLEEVMFH